MPVYAQWCPSCGIRVGAKDHHYSKSQSFSCPACGAPLRVAARYVGLTAVVSLVLAVSVAWYLGLNGARFVVASIVGFPIALLTSSYVIGIFLPFRVELREPTDFPVRFPDGPR